jgi:hypothetical protein
MSQRHRQEHPGDLPHRSTKELLSGLEGERIVSLVESARLNGISIDTLKRRHSDKILRLSTGRLGMRLKDALNIAQPLTA